MADDTHTQILFKALETALTLAAERKWTSVTLLEISKTANVDLKALYALNGRDAITGALDAWADQAMFASDIDMDDTPRERLFDVIMNRFESMEPYRSGVLSLLAAIDRMPLKRTELFAERKKTAHWAMICSGLDTIDGAEQILTEVGLIWALRKTEQAWRKDTDGTFTHTMARLDEELVLLQERVERARGVFSGSLFGGRAQSAAPKQEAPVSPEAPQAESDPA